ncbi:MAG: hypothetical protein U0667_06525 [Chloroflexota bacterium]
MVPIPGASSVLAALMAVGVPAPRWAFEGFLPRKGTEGVASDWRASPMTARRSCSGARPDGGDAPGPRHGMRRRPPRSRVPRAGQAPRGGPPGRVLGDLAAGARETPPRGEVTIVLAGARPGASRATDAPVDLAEGRLRVARLMAAGVTRAEAAKLVARETGLPRRRLFRDDGAGGSSMKAIPVLRGSPVGRAVLLARSRSASCPSCWSGASASTAPIFIVSAAGITWAWRTWWAPAPSASVRSRSRRWAASSTPPSATSPS